MTAFDFDQPIDRTGRGSYKWDRYPADVLPMWVADMDFRCPPAVLDAMRAEIDHGVFGYAKPEKALLETVVARLARCYGWQIEPEWVVWCPGVVAAMAACCRIAGERGDEIIASPPVYHHLLSVPQGAGRTLVNAPLHCVDGRWTLDFDALRAAITPRTRMLLLCSPHNPVGTVFTHDELAELGQLCAEHNVLLCSDEIHCDLILEPELQHIPTALACPEYRDGVITLMAPSKTFNLAGANCSFAVIAEPALRQRFQQAIAGVVPMVSPLANAAALAAFRDSDDWHSALLDYLRGNRDLLAAEIATIPGLSMAPVQATYLGWIDTRQLDCDDPHALFLQYGLGFSDGEQFGGRGYQRINFACTRGNLREAIARMRAAVASLGSHLR